jgi:serine/threonine protein kinase
MSTGKRPFGGDGKNFMVIFGEILTKTPLEPCKVKETVDSEFSTIIMKSLQKEPAKRYQSGNELFQAIRNCNTRDIPLPKPGTSSLTPRIIIGASAVAVAALAAGALFIFSSGKREASEPPPKTMTAAPTASSPAAAPEAGTTLPPVAAPVTTSTPVASPPVVSPQYPHRETTGTSMVKRVKQHPTAASSDETIKKNAATKKSEPVGTVHRSEQSSAPNQTGERESAAVVGGELTSVKYAFLKVTSNPSEADVFINGSFKGKTPLNLRLTLGRYLVRLGRSGYKNVETSVTLDKMSEFPLTKELVAE